MQKPNLLPCPCWLSTHYLGRSVMSIICFIQIAKPKPVHRAYKTMWRMPLAEYFVEDGSRRSSAGDPGPVSLTGHLNPTLSLLCDAAESRSRRPAVGRELTSVAHEVYLRAWRFPVGNPFLTSVQRLLRSPASILIFSAFG
jgi:hypothetical protein